CSPSAPVSIAGTPDTSAGGVAGDPAKSGERSAREPRVTAARVSAPTTRSPRRGAKGTGGFCRGRGTERERGGSGMGVLPSVTSAAGRPGAPGRGQNVRLLDERKEDRLADAEAGDRHEQPVDTHAHPAHGRHAVLHRAQELLVEPHRLDV